MEPTTQPIAEATNPNLIPNGLTFRIEYLPDQIGSFQCNPRPAPLKNWDRVFEVSDKITLVQFATIIRNLLGWEEDHLYEFHIGGEIHVHMGDPNYSDYFVDAVNPCFSCVIRLHNLKLTSGTEFDFIFDFGRWHLFRLTLLSTSPHRDRRPLPSLISHQGKNLLQYSGLISKSQRQLIQEKVPTIKAPPPSGDTTTVISFVRAEDHTTLLKWRASNNKTLWQKSVTVLENRNLSVEKISEKIERPVGVIKRWIVAFNHRGMLGLNPPRKKRSPGKREAAAEKRKKRLLDILHDRPRSFGISRASWSLTSLAKAYAEKYGEPV